MIILVDQDGVIADFAGAFYEEWGKRYPDKPLIGADKRKSLYFKEEHPEYIKAIKEIIYGEGFYRNLEPVPGAVSALQEMQKVGHKVFICTSPLTSSKYCAQEKLLWVKEHLGLDFVRRTIITKDKTIVQGDILIDDKPEIKGSIEPSWEHVLYDAPYNRYVKEKRRLTWDNWKKVLSV